MILLQIPQLFLVLTAVVCTLTGALRKGAGFLSYVGGFFWAAASIIGMVRGAELSEVLLFTLLLLLLSGLKLLVQRNEADHEL